MNTEKKKQLEVFGWFLVVALCASLYAWGGIENKWLRRFLAPGIATLAMFIKSRDWRNLLCFPLWCAGLSLGYGASEVWLKVAKRALYGLSVGIGGNVGNLLNKRFLVACFSTILCMSAYIVLGVWNPMPEARTEEFVLGVLVFLFPIMSAKRRM
jgi:hypothetical protein